MTKIVAASTNDCQTTTRRPKPYAQTLAIWINWGAFGKEEEMLALNRLLDICH